MFKLGLILASFLSTNAFAEKPRTEYLRKAKVSTVSSGVGLVDNESEAWITLDGWARNLCGKISTAQKTQMLNLAGLAIIGKLPVDAYLEIKSEKDFVGCIQKIELHSGD